MKVIAEKFGFSYPLSEAIKVADGQMLQLEWDFIILRKEGQFLEIYNNVNPKSQFLNLFNYYNALIKNETSKL